MRERLRRYEVGESFLTKAVSNELHELHELHFWVLTYVHTERAQQIAVCSMMYLLSSQCLFAAAVGGIHPSAAESADPSRRTKEASNPQVYGDGRWKDYHNMSPGDEDVMVGWNRKVKNMECAKYSWGHLAKTVVTVYVAWTTNGFVEVTQLVIQAGEICNVKTFDVGNKFILGPKPKQ